jgi:hypothetical protein
MERLTARKENSMRRLLTILVALALVSASACGGGGGGGGGGGPKDMTDREITDEELSLMVLPQSDLGPQYADFKLDDTSGLQSNDAAINNAFDTEDEAQDVQRFGRANGYEESYTFSAAQPEEKGPIHIATGVILHNDADGASGNLNDGVGDAQRAVSMTKDNVTIQSVDTFEVGDIGQEAVGLIQKASFKVDQGDLAVDQTMVGFREGRLIGSVAITSLAGADVQEEATALARKLDERILAVLRGEVQQPAPASQASPAPTSEATPEPTSEATPGPSAGVSPSDVLESFRFSGKMSIELDGGLVLTSEGEFEAPDRLGCTVSGSLDGTEVGKDELVVIGNDAWLDTGEGFQTSTADDANVAQDLALCPGSAAFWEGFDFLQNPGSIPSQPDTINGVDTTRYSLGSAVEALKSIGFLPTELEGMTISKFDVWVAEDGGWPVALDMDITADAQTAAETFGLPLGEGAQQARITMRVDITDANATDIHVEAPAP